MMNEAKALRLKYQLLFWMGAFAAFLLIVYVFKGVLLPFVLGAAVAYLLNPTVSALGRMRIARAPAAILILGGFFLIVGALLAVLSPLIYDQFLQLAQDLPRYADQALNWAEPYMQQALSLIGQESETDLRSLLEEHGSALFGRAGTAAGSVLGGIAAGGQAALDVVTLFVFVPLVAYFLMKEWPRITQWVEDLLPRQHEDTIKDLIHQIDVKISGFVRGQLIVAVVLGIIYAVALTIAGLNYGFLIGIGAGVLSVIPMIGSTVGLIVSVLVAWFQSGEISYVALIGGIFIAGQILEGNFITPKVVGESVGLHPLWVFFALLAGGSLFGILGMFLSVPVAAVAGVLLSFAITLYKGSAYFKGPKGAGESDTKDGGAQRDA